MRSARVVAPHTRAPERAASAKFSTGTTASRRPSACAAINSGNTPGTALIDPSSPSSPISTHLSAASAGTTSAAASRAIAIATSYPAPRFGRLAGDRANVTLVSGNFNPELCTAARIRSLACALAASPVPITFAAGKPLDRSASTRTTRPATPSNATVQVRPTAISAVPSEGLDPVIDDRLASGLPQHADHVESRRRIATCIGPQPQRGQAAQLAALGVGHRLHRLPVADPAAGLHLTEHHLVRPRHQRDDVQFPFRTPPVARHHDHAAVLQIPRRQLLALPAQHVLGRHSRPPARRRRALRPGRQPAWRMEVSG